MEVRLDRGEVGKSVEKKQKLWTPPRNGNFDGFSNFRRKTKKKNDSQGNSTTSYVYTISGPISP